MTAQLPKTYKAVVLREPNGSFKLEDVELKQPSAGQILVKVLACGVCFTDTAFAAGRKGNHLFPRVPGHEVVGDIVQIGDGVQDFTVGQRVGGAWHGGHDGDCQLCQREQFQFCDNKAINGITRDGGYAEYVLLRAEAVVRVPAEMNPAEVAPLLCAGVTVFNGIRKMQIEKGSLIAIQGLGGLGHLAVQYANKMGFQVALVSSGGDDKAEFAKSLGAHHFISTTSSADAPAELLKLGGAALIIQTAPNPKVVGPLLHGLAVGGKLLSLAGVGLVDVDTVLMVGRALSVHGWPSGHARDTEEAIEFAMKHGVRCMVNKFPFADVQGAVDSLLAGKARFKNVLVME